MALYERIKHTYSIIIQHGRNFMFTEIKKNQSFSSKQNNSSPFGNFRLLHIFKRVVSVKLFLHLEYFDFTKILENWPFRHRNERSCSRWLFETRHPVCRGHPPVTSLSINFRASLVANRARSSSEIAKTRHARNRGKKRFNLLLRAHAGPRARLLLISY